jgi:hypothetical protein
MHFSFIILTSLFASYISLFVLSLSLPKTIITYIIFCDNALPIRVDHKNQELSVSVRDIAYYRTPRMISPSFSFKSAERGREVHHLTNTTLITRQNIMLRPHFPVKTGLSLYGDGST